MKRLLWLCAGTLLWAACQKKDDPSLSGPTSEPGFTYAVNQVPGGDTLPYVNKVAFTNTSTDAFSYYWDFGDATTSVDANPVKQYALAGVYDVKLTSIGKGGNKTILQRVSIGSSCDYAPFSALTGCNSRKWQMSPASDAITIFNTDGSVAYSGSPANCQSDDVYTFFADGTMGYDAKGQTFVANEGPNPYSCQGAQQNAPGFYMLKNEGGNPKIVLKGGIGRNPFLGSTDSVVGNTYEILTVTDASLKIQGILAATSQKIQLTFLNGFDINTIKLFLTGGSRRTWRLDSTAGANAVTAGLEANPGQYYSGGPLASCQKDDWYTFTMSDSVYANLNGEALQPSQGFICNTEPNQANKMTFSAVQGSVAGLAQISLQSGNAAQWIGIKDRAPENVYRIIAIDNDHLELRSGNGSATVHELKLVRK